MPFAGVSQGPKNATLRHAMRGALDAVARMMGDQHAEQARGLQTGPASAMGSETWPPSAEKATVARSSRGWSSSVASELSSGGCVRTQRHCARRRSASSWGSAASSAPRVPVVAHSAAWRDESEGGSGTSGATSVGMTNCERSAASTRADSVPTPASMRSLMK